MEATEAFLPHASSTKPPPDSAAFFDFVESHDFNYNKTKSAGAFEPNNNEQPKTEDFNNFENTIFWSDRDGVKLEGGILDEINNWSDWAEKTPDPNTDGAVYTLTVLNSNDTWYKVPEKTKKPESLDIDSFLNIIPETESSSNYYYPEFPFSDAKEPLVGNNNDWKATNQNDSLLRNALQGKGNFQRNYAMCKKVKSDDSRFSDSPFTVTAPSFEETSNIDEILGLSTIDSFSEDYEKIQKEVAECVKYPSADPCSSFMLDSRKKYAKKSVSAKPGVRKERSLHYCSICSKGFKDKYSVNVHVRTHTGEKPFTCTLCGKSFRQKAHLAKHYQTHLAQSQKHLGGVVGGKRSKGGEHR